jgi:hypothetical protein
MLRSLKSLNVNARSPGEIYASASVLTEDFGAATDSCVHREACGSTTGKRIDTARKSRQILGVQVMRSRVEFEASMH